MVSSITNNLGFSISKDYEPNRNLIVGVSNYFGANSVSSFEYENDVLGRRTERLDFDENLLVKTNSFIYNGYSELTNAIMNTDNYNFTFDDIGNREEFQMNTTSVDYENSQLNQCLEANSLNPAYDKSFAFDLDGNMVTNGTWRYIWNAENRMTSASNTVNDAYITYSYDYQGRMIKKITDTETTLFYWNGNHIVSEMTDSSTNLYCWSQGETLTASLDGKTVFYCHDANKNITELVDTNGDSVAHYEYSPFGVITEQTGTFAEDNPFRFSNEYWDSDLKKVTYLFRFYDPWLGKFMSRDPIGKAGGLNLYGFVLNAPIDAIDWLGRCKLEIHDNLSKEEIEKEKKKKSGGDKHDTPYGFFAGILANYGLDKQVVRNNVKCGGWFSKKKMYSVDYMPPCEGHIYIRSDAPALTLEHEKHHYYDYKEWYDKTLKLLYKYDNVCVCEDCYIAITRWMDGQQNIYTLERMIKGLKNDLTDYPKIGHPKSKIEELEEDLRFANGGLRRLKAELLDLAAKRKEACK